MKHQSDSLSELSSLLNDLPAEKKDLEQKDPIPPKGEDFENRDLDRVDYAQDIELKKAFANHVLYITYGWLIFLVILFIISGIINTCQGHPFASDTILVTLVSGTSLSIIIGMLSIILRHLITGGKRH